MKKSEDWKGLTGMEVVVRIGALGVKVRRKHCREMVVF